MLTIGEFSRICQVSTKTLRYYAEIGLILPEEINPENGYRYYSIGQLETMMLINRLKEYELSLEEKQFTVAAPPMVLFHHDEYRPLGLDTEFAVPVKEYATGTRDFCPGLCLKTVVHGSYSQLPSVYAKQIQWAEEDHYENRKPLYEVYLTNPAEALKESELVTEGVIRRIV